jgi:hypothetical protein
MVERVGASKAKVFSLMDLRSAYHQIEIDKESRKFVAFHVPGLGNYQYTRLPFGLKLSGNFFNYLVGTAIASDEILSAHCMAYVDDVFIYTIDEETHLLMLDRLFKVLRNTGLKIHNEKCEFLKEKVKFVGHIFGKDGISPEFGKIEAMVTFPVPRTKKQLRSFIGLVTFYRQYIKNLSHDLEPLLVLLRKDERFVWNEERERAFQTIREKLRDLPTLAFPDESPGAGPFVIETDASSYSIAGTLAQRSRDGTETHLIACFGRSLKSHEFWYTVCEKECLALITAALKFQHIIKGKKVIIRSDNLNVRYFNTLHSTGAPRMMRWSIYCNEILANATFEHVKGPLNVVPDALSRREYPDTEPLSTKEMEVTQDILPITAVADTVVRNVSVNEEVGKEIDSEMDDQFYFEFETDLVNHLLQWQMYERGVTQELEGLLSYQMEEEDDDNDEINVVPCNNIILPITYPQSEAIEYDSGDVSHERELREYHLSQIWCTNEDTPQRNSLIKKLLLHSLLNNDEKGYVPCNVITRAQAAEQLSAEVTPDTVYPLEPNFDELFEEDEEKDKVQKTTITKTKEKQEGSIQEDKQEPNVFSFVQTDEHALQKAQLACPEIGDLVRYLRDQHLPNDNDHLVRKIIAQAETHFLDDNGVLCGLKFNKNKRTKEFKEVVEWKVIPRAMRQEILFTVHNSSHPGIAKMCIILEDLHYGWPGSVADVKRYVLSCPNCSMGKRGLFRPKSKIANMEIPQAPHQQLSIDLVGPLTTTPSGNNYILTVLDVFSGYMWLMPLKGQTSLEIAENLIDVFSHTGIPDKIITDLGQNLMSSVIQDLCELLHITHFKTMAYMHRSNRVERNHRILGDMLRTMLQESEIGMWDKYLKLMQLYLRSQPTLTNPYPPAEIEFGRNVNTPTSSQIEAFEHHGSADVSEYVAELKRRMKWVIEAQRKCKLLNNEESRSRYDRLARPFAVQEGMLVYLYNDAKKQGLSSKLQQEFTGPYKILEVLSEHSVKLRNEKNQKILRHPVHVDRLKPMVERISEEREVETETVPESVHPGIESGPSLDEQSRTVTESATLLDKVPQQFQEMSQLAQEIVTPGLRHPSAEVSDDEGIQIDVPKRTRISDNVYEIEGILRSKGYGNNRKYLVKWKDSPTEKFKDSWVAAHDVTQLAIDKFNEREARKRARSKHRVIRRRRA